MRTQNEFHEERDKDLWHTYLQVCENEMYSNGMDAVRRSVQHEAPRFYVSDERAVRVLSWMMNGDERMERMMPKRREMFHEIYRRTMALRAQHPGSSLTELVRRVVCRPAPEYYLTPKSGYMILRQMRRRRRSEKMKQLLVHVKRLQNNLED
jgi:hypothetical protein